MTKITCAELTCKHNRDNYICKANGVELSSHSIVTVNEGRQQFWRCKQYEMDERSKEIFARLSVLMNDE